MAEFVERGRGLALVLEYVPTARVTVDLTLDAVRAVDEQGQNQQCGTREALKTRRARWLRAVHGDISAIVWLRSENHAHEQGNV